MSEDRARPTNAPNSATQLDKDPVCGMNVDPGTAKFFHEHAGKTYYFCCGHCVEKFKAAPQSFLGRSAATGLITLGTAAAKTSIGAELARDPVCGMSVNPSTAKFVIDRDGKKYYFCSQSCREKFEADPTKYLAKPPVPGAE